MLRGPFLAPSRIGYSFYIVYIQNFADPGAYNIVTSLSLSRCRDGIRSRSPVTLIKGPYWSRFGLWSSRT
jgi:hypothetical protein